MQESKDKHMKIKKNLEIYFLRKKIPFFFVEFFKSKFN